MTTVEITKRLQALKSMQYADPRRSYALADALITECETKGLTEPALVEAYLIRAQHFDYMARYAESQRDAEHARDLAQQAGNDLHLAQALYQISSAMYSLGKQLDALDLLHRAYTIATKLDHAVTMGLAARRLAFMYNDLGFLATGMEFTRSAYEHLKGTEFEPTALVQLVYSTADRTLHNDLLNRALAIVEKSDNLVMRMYVLNTIGGRANCTEGLRLAQALGYDLFTLLFSSSLAEIELAERKYDAAKRIILDLIPSYQRTGEHYKVAQLLVMLATIALSQQQPQAVLEYLSQASALVPEGIRINYHVDVDELYSQAYEALGNFEQALLYERRFRQKRERWYTESYRSQERHTTDLIAVERERHERNNETMKRQQVEKELSSATMHLAMQTELLGNFRNELRQIVREIDEPIQALKRIKEKLKELPCEQIDWIKFEKQFTNVHPEFKAKLTAKYPNLTKQEIKMCQLARLGLKTFEMARLLCLSERSIESHRYTLRKKLGIPTEQNLTQFLSTIRS